MRASIFRGPIMTITRHLLAGVALAAFTAPTLAQRASPLRLAAADTAVATTDAAAAATSATPEGDAIIVTGVRGSRARTVANSPVPIDVINAKELQATGRTGLKEILGNIVPSLEMPALGGGGTTCGGVGIESHAEQGIIGRPCSR